jgi:hypothetical protein
MKIGPQPRGGIAAPGVNLYDERGFETDGAPTNSLLTRTAASLVAKNILASTNAEYLTFQDAINAAIPVVDGRDTGIARGTQGLYGLGEVNLLVDGASANFVSGAQVGQGPSRTVAFDHILSGGRYEGITFYSHNGGQANKLVIENVDISNFFTLDILLAGALGSGIVDQIDLVRLRGTKTRGFSNYGRGVVNFVGNTYANDRPVRINVIDCEAGYARGPFFDGVAPRGTTIHIDAASKLKFFGKLQTVRSADEPGSDTVPYTDAEILVYEPGSGTPGTGGGTSGDVRDPYDVDTAKRKQVVDAGVPILVESDEAYYGKEFVDEVYGPDRPAYYKCRPSAPAQTGGATLWKWFRSDIL